MARGQHRSAGVRLLWSILFLLALSGCQAAHRFEYDYALIAPISGTEGVIEDDQARVRVVPTDEVGVVHLAVANKSPLPIVIVWSQSYYIDPLGYRRHALQTGGQQIIRSPGWFAEDMRIAAGGEVRITVRPGGLPVERPVRGSQGRNPVDPRLPPEEDAYGTAQVGGQFTLNPFTASRYQGGTVVLSGAPPPFVPSTGDSVEIGQAYKERDFRFVLTLRHSDGMVPYTFMFRITDVQVR
jgi:hypothetical protein